MHYVRQVAIAIDQLINTALGGWADETLSSRIWREAKRQPPQRSWRVLYRAVNGLFFWQRNHCRSAYERERGRWHLPPDLRYGLASIVRKEKR